MCLYESRVQARLNGTVYPTENGEPYLFDNGACALSVGPSHGLDARISTTSMCQTGRPCQIENENAMFEESSVECATIECSQEHLHHSNLGMQLNT
jgi:hypothetical protein